MKTLEFATLIGISEDTVRSLESGRLELSETIAGKMQVEFGISRTWLLDGDPAAPPFEMAGRPYTLKLYAEHRACILKQDEPPKEFMDRTMLLMLMGIEWYREAVGRGEKPTATWLHFYDSFERSIDATASSLKIKPRKQVRSPRMQDREIESQVQVKARTRKYYEETRSLLLRLLAQCEKSIAANTPTNAKPRP